ncbi:MAG TPA: HEAT repeat domain-containing protein [Bacteroidota bacterium]|nr:HEAT repeat domain-containing protein [Bacteroidota bacterium]
MTDETRRNISVLIADDDSDARRHAAEDLAGERGLAPIAALAAALQDANKGVRDTACRSLLVTGGADAARAVVEYVCSPNIVTRNLATDLLMKIGLPGVPALLPYLKDVDHDVRKAVVDVFGLIEGNVQVGPVLELLSDPDPNVVVSAVEALGNMKSPLGVAGLEETFERCDYARPAVAEALGKTGDPRSRDFVMAKLRHSLARVSEDPLTLLGLVEAAGAVGGNDALDLLARGYGGIPPGIRAAALHAIARIASRTGTPLPPLPGIESVLAGMLNMEDLQVRTSAATWLRQRAGAESVAAMVQAYGASPEVDALLAGALMDRRESLPALAAALEGGPGPSARGKAALLSQLILARIRAVMRTGEAPSEEGLIASAFDAVARAWENADQDTRSSLIDAMFRLDGDRAVQFLDAILEQPDPWLRMHVIEVIAAIADSRAPVYLTRFLNDEDEMVRELAENVLRAKGFVSDEA